MRAKRKHGSRGRDSLQLVRDGNIVTVYAVGDRTLNFKETKQFDTVREAKAYLNS